METIILAQKIAKREIYEVNDCSKRAQSCDLVLSDGKKGTIILRDNVPLLHTELLKNNWLLRICSGRKYRSQYSADLLPYFDNGWKDFIWREFIDGKEFARNEQFPQSLSDFFDAYETIETEFRKQIDVVLSMKSEPRKILPRLLDIYWAEFLCRYKERESTLYKLYPLLAALDEKMPCPENKIEIVSIPQFLSRIQEMPEFDLASLAEDYLRSISLYLQQAFYSDYWVLKDIYGDEEIGQYISILAYEDYLKLFKTVDMLLSYLE